MQATIFDLCFADVEGFVEIASGGLKGSNRKWVPLPGALHTLNNPIQGEMYFGPAVRQKQGVMGKTNCKGSWVCWVDVDRMEPPSSILPPSAIIWSGHGWHYYWKFDEFVTDASLIEQANEVLSKSVRGDSAHNVDRVLRVPDSYNLKDPNVPIQVQARYLEMHSYDTQSILAIPHVSDKVMRKITTGDSRGHRSKSERDWAIVQDLVTVGFSTDTIKTIFKYHPCGDKYRDPAEGGDRYLEHTISRVKSSGKRQQEPVLERDNCYFMRAGKGARKVSTFVLEPILLLESRGSEGDSICANVHAFGTEQVWPNIVFPRDAFSRVGSLGKYLPRTSWIWLGNDSDVRNLLAHLSAQIQKQSVPTAHKTSVLGMYSIGGLDYFAANTGTIGPRGQLHREPIDSPVVYVPTGREAPELEFSDDPDPEDFETLSGIIPRLNDPSKIWPILGWYMASPMKVLFARLGYRFPILNVCGTRGSGKTTTIHSMLRLLGITDPCSYDVGTTRFVMLSLLGSTNAVPISFSEFRESIQDDSVGRYIRLSYDIGKDARGRPDQTTIEYPLIAPFSVDGEDKLDDPAVLERSIVVNLSPHAIEEGSDSWEAFQELGDLSLESFALPYYRYIITHDVAILLDEAEQDVYEAFPIRLPDRVRKNLTICWAGILSFTKFMEAAGAECEVGSASILREALENVYSIKMKRAPVAADEFIEFVVNGAAKNTGMFPYCLEEGILWFQCAPAYEVYVSFKARQRQNVLSRSSYISQMLELKADYMVAPEVRDIKGKKVLSFGVDILSAHKHGLDIPESFNPKYIVMDL
jgi:hypothetical protein